MRCAITIMFILLMATSTTKATEEPTHSVVQKDGDIEVRQYEPMLVARVQVQGDMREASSTGFRSLAKFIFGGNRPAEKIEMTAPVMREKSTKIQMTTPVTREQNDDNNWTVTFVMPKQWTKETLPKPNNKDIIIDEQPGQLLATIKFSGLGREKSHQREQSKLEAWITDNGYRVAGSPLYAGYDAPWVLPFLRRNEVMIQVEKLSDSSID